MHKLMYIQLSSCILQRCVSIGNKVKSKGHDRVIDNLKIQKWNLKTVDCNKKKIIGIRFSASKIAEKIKVIISSRLKFSYL